MTSERGVASHPIHPLGLPLNVDLGRGDRETCQKISHGSLYITRRKKKNFCSGVVKHCHSSL